MVERRPQRHIRRTGEGREVRDYGADSPTTFSVEWDPQARTDLAGGPATGDHRLQLPVLLPLVAAVVAAAM